MMGVDELASTLGVPEQRVEERGKDMNVALTPAELRSALAALVRHSAWRHLSAITGQQREQEIELLYHCWLGQEITLRLSCPVAGAEIPSVSAMAPVAAWYEREVHDLLGVVFADHPGLHPLLLSEDWQGPPPLLEQEPDA